MSEHDVRNILAYLMDLKLAACSAEGGPSDLAPFVTGGFADGAMAVAELPAPREGFVEAVAQIRLAHPGTLTWVAQCADVLVKHRSAEHDALGDPDARAMSLSDARNAGDMTVVDALSVYLVKVDGNEYTGQVFYRYGDSGEPEFDPPRMELATGRGFVPNALRSALAASTE